MDITKAPSWFRQRLNGAARAQWAARPTGVKCSYCGGEIIAINEVAYNAIRRVAGQVELPCRECARERR